jgi:hypothetical protein
MASQSWTRSALLRTCVGDGVYGALSQRLSAASIAVVPAVVGGVSFSAFPNR